MTLNQRCYFQKILELMLESPHKYCFFIIISWTDNRIPENYKVCMVWTKLLILTRNFESAAGSSNQPGPSLPAHWGKAQKCPGAGEGVLAAMLLPEGFTGHMWEQQKLLCLRPKRGVPELQRRHCLWYTVLVHSTTLKLEIAVRDNTALSGNTSLKVEDKCKKNTIHTQQIHFN